MNDRITLRLGTLAEPLAAAAATNERDLSSEIRQRLAESLGVPVPDMRQGFASLTPEQLANVAKRGLRARQRRD